MKHMPEDATARRARAGGSQRISTCLWFDTQAEEAAEFYVSLFDNSRITAISRYGDHGPMPEGTVLTVVFELDGVEFMALNGGPHFSFSEASSMVVKCATQAEIDRVWARLLDNGGKEQQCGWIKDRYGLPWQVVPDTITELLTGPDKERSNRVMKAVHGMIKIDMTALQAAYDGK
jgi:predicted 3-demethylubiquinone-9 3-methyltransferase (glyoxalase superfamily)